MTPDTRKFCNKCDGVVGGDCECEQPIETLNNDELLARIAKYPNECGYRKTPGSRPCTQDRPCLLHGDKRG